MYIVADTSHLHFEIDVNPEDIGEVKRGLAVDFRPESAREYVASGKISHIVPEIDEKTRKVRVHAEFENPNGRMRPNTFGTVRILIDKHEGATLVPKEAVQSDGNSYFVLVEVSATTFRPRLVELGLRDADKQEVVNGVHAGERVVTKGSFLLKSELLKDKIAGGDD